jgi:hypothetical protein
MTEVHFYKPDWVLIEAAKRCGWEYGTAELYYDNPVYAALCDMIERYEQPPPDRKLLCAREAITQSHDEDIRTNIGHWEWIALRAIELWEGGFGK